MRSSFAYLLPLGSFLGCIAACNSGAGGEAANAAADAATAPAADAGAGANSGDASAASPAAPGTGVVCGDRDKYKHVYFGDLHTHTSYSADAFGFATRNEPTDAWAFARGTPLQTAISAPIPGPMVTIKRKLDFDAITDHSEWLAVGYACGTDAHGQPILANSPLAQNCAPYLAQANGGLKAIAAARQVLTAKCGSPDEEQGACLGVVQSAWQAEQQAANAAYMPCTFTSFIAYEWTNADPVTTATLHKNVIFADEHAPDHPFDSADYPTAPDLWTALDTWLAQDPSCKNGATCAALTIPHNSNKSWGGAFAVPTTSSGVDQMLRYQKLVEIHQTKGNSECYFDPASPSKDADPDCNFEHLTPGADGPLDRQNYVRTALEDGIASYADAGVNPLQLGIVGATDDHNGMPGSVAEDTWRGHTGQNDYGAKERITHETDKNPGGITGVWAEQNTRDSIFAALSRRETYGTSGVFMTVRAFQTWQSTDFCTGGFPQNIIDAKGIPMGGSIDSTGGGATGQGPYLYVSAAKDEADLARVDIIKGTIKNGKVVETVTPIPAPNPGAFCVRWQDTAFDPKAPTFYYARVLQVPMPRWSHYDCQKTGPVGDCAPGGSLDVDIQERAWTSPMWSLP